MDKSKYEAYKRYDWVNDEKWQQYLTGLFPTPTAQRLEKMRRKWYKKNKVPDFDPDFDEQEFLKKQQQARQAPPMSDQQRFQQQYQQQYAQQNPGAYYASNQNNFTDRAPQFASLQILLWSGYLVTLVLGRYSHMVCFAANAIGLIRKCGMPNWSAAIQYLQSAAFQDEFSNMTYLMATMMTSSNLFVSGPMIVSALLFLTVEFQKKLRANPSFPVLSIGKFKELIQKGAGHELQNYGRQVKADMEVYCGFYLVGMIFLGGANFLGVVMFWQMQRMRYMVSVPLQMGFQRLDQSIQSFLNAGWCPGIIRTGYMGIRSFLSSMTDAQAQQARMQQSGGGIMGAMKNSCNIF